CRIYFEGRRQEKGPPVCSHRTGGVRNFRRHPRCCHPASAWLVEVEDQPGRGFHLRFDMERNCGPMKPLAGTLVVLFLLCPLALAQQARGTSLSPNLFGSIA